MTNDSPSARLRTQETLELAQMIVVTSDPNGSIRAAESTFAWDRITKYLWQNTDGDTAWAIVSTSGGIDDELVKVSSADLSSGYLDDKLVVETTSLAKQILNPAGAEQLEIDFSAVVKATTFFTLSSAAGSPFTGWRQLSFDADDFDWVDNGGQSTFDLSIDASIARVADLTDETVRVTASDTTDGYLDDKIVVPTSGGLSLAKTVQTPGGNETLLLDFSTVVKFTTFFTLNTSFNTPFSQHRRLNFLIGDFVEDDQGAGNNFNVSLDPSVARTTDLHNPVTLQTQLDDNLLSISGTQVLELDLQQENLVFASSDGGGVDYPDWRKLSADDFDTGVLMPEPPDAEIYGRQGGGTPAWVLVVAASGGAFQNPAGDTNLYVQANNVGGDGLNLEHRTDGDALIRNSEPNNTLFINQDQSGSTDDASIAINIGSIVVNNDEIDLDFIVKDDAGSDALFVRGSDGRVGIGTNNPNEPLDIRGSEVHINNSSGLTRLRFLSQGASISDGVTLTADQSSGSFHFTIENQEEGNISLQTGGATPNTVSVRDGTTIFNASGQNVNFDVRNDVDPSSEPSLFVRGSDGHVGIGTNAPSSRFTINGDGYYAVRMDQDTATTSTDLIFSKNGSNRWIFRMDGAAESGGNAGTNFVVMSRTDAGAAHETLISLTRSNGDVRILAGELKVGFPTGGGGAGYVNVQNEVQQNGSDYDHPGGVYEHYFSGDIKKFTNPIYEGYKGLPSIEQLKQRAKEHHRIWFRNSDRQEFGVFGHTVLLEANLEIAMCLIFEMDERIKWLEAQFARLGGA